MHAQCYIAGSSCQLCMHKWTGVDVSEDLVARMNALNQRQKDHAAAAASIQNDKALLVFEAVTQLGNFSKVARLFGYTPQWTRDLHKQGERLAKEAGAAR